MSSLSVKKLKFLFFILSILIFPVFLGQYIPVPIKAVSYALSLSMKSVLEFLLPFIIFSFVFSCLSNLQKGALLFVFLLIICVFVSNFSALMFGYTSGYIGLNLLHFTATPMASAPQLEPAWHFHLVKLISNDIALLIGFGTGILFFILAKQEGEGLGGNLK